MKEKTIKLIMTLMWIGVILASIKSIFTDTGFDNSYTVAMSYRHLNGDTLLGTMWEPHQTSIFVSDLLMKIYSLLVPDFTGVMIYLQICGTLMSVLVGIAIYYTLLPAAGTVLSQLACMFFVIFKVKQSPFPDYANLMIMFSALMFTTLVKYIKHQEKRGYLYLSAGLLCLTVLAYPSAAVILIPVWIIFWIYSEKRLKDIVCFTVTCGAIGSIYILYFVIKIGFSQLLSNLQNIIYTDGHSGEQLSTYVYFWGITEAITWLGLTLIISLIIKRFVVKFKKKEAGILSIWGIVLFLSETIMLLTQKKNGIDWTCMLYVIPILMTGIGGLAYKKMTDGEKLVWITGTLISAGTFFAAYFLSYLGMITLVAYMVLGGSVSVIPLKYYKRQGMAFFIAMVMLVTVHRGLVVWGYANAQNIFMIQDVQTIMRSGLHKGIVCDYHLYHQIHDDSIEMENLISSDDNVLMVGGWIMDSMEFAMTEASISNYSTIDTTYYNDRLLNYYETYPNKVPTVVMLSHEFIKADNFMFNWITDNYELVYEGEYWDYYR